MLMQDSPLWSKLEAYSPDNPNDALTFSQRLARENGWSPHLTERVINEYKKFLFLCTISPHPVTPSDEVDQAWHLHLVYTKSYWNDLCRDILQKDLHHTPTEGGPSERQKFFDLYEATLQLYRLTFNETPPDDIWPPSEIRFSHNHFVRTNTSTHWLIHKPAWKRNYHGIWLILAGIVLAWLFSNFGVFVLLGFVGFVILTPNRNRQGGSGCSGGCGGGCAGSDSHSGCSGDGGCSGGCGGGCGGGD
ncbi:glycine-rich domain-containing protein [Paraflavitalea pollutisoli]|uniref:glycine-rich domain-containing protein n=1 Tax=Paraflavitalea pollutisoli TaxID=3034143 RepID=UPI0023ED5020|nr:hypothetical protein [Paraflavitalea sp. H1-2-19X]